MMGIIAAIIAAIKGHTTYAVCMGIWTIIAFILDASGSSQYAVAPGGLFVIIAICMKNLRKANAAKGIKEKKAPIETSDKESDHNNPSLICKKCGEKLLPEWEFCNNCGYPVRKQEDFSDGNNISTTTTEKLEDNLTKSIAISLPSTPYSSMEYDGISTKNILNLDLNTLPVKLRRAFRLIEDEEWDKATEYFDKILDDEPENAHAYLGKAMIKAKVSSPENLTEDEIHTMFKTRSFARASGFAEGDLKDLLANWKNI